MRLEQSWRMKTLPPTAIVYVCSNVLNIGSSHFCLVRHMVISACLASPKQGRANSANKSLPTFVERAQGSCRVAKLGLFLEPCLTECLEDCVLIPKFYHDAKWLLPIWYYKHMMIQVRLSPSSTYIHSWQSDPLQWKRNGGSSHCKETKLVD